MSDLITRLESSPEGFDLFQAMSLLERAEPDRAGLGCSLGVDEAARLLGDPRLSFAPSDVVEVGQSPEAGGPPRFLSTAALTLAGAQGPLPLPLAEHLLERKRQRDTAALDFLDIFNQRLLAFLYRSRRKHRPGLGVAGLQASPIGQVMRALGGQVGLAGQDLLESETRGGGPHGEQVWLRHVAVQAAAPRSMASLLAVLSDRTGLRWSGRSFIGEWLPLPVQDQARLGSRRAPGCVLGQGQALGQRAWDAAAALEVSTGPLGVERMSALLPGQPEHRRVAWLVESHLQSPIKARLRLQPNVAQLPRQRLGARGPQLGLTSWLETAPGSQREPQPVCVRLSAQESPARAATPAPSSIGPSA
jgi:type VI secretion system protein ImpH